MITEGSEELGVGADLHRMRGIQQHIELLHDFRVTIRVIAGLSAPESARACDRHAMQVEAHGHRLGLSKCGWS